MRDKLTNSVILRATHLSQSAMPDTGPSHEQTLSPSLLPNNTHSWSRMCSSYVVDHSRKHAKGRRDGRAAPAHVVVWFEQPTTDHFHVAATSTPLKENLLSHSTRASHRCHCRALWCKTLDKRVGVYLQQKQTRYQC